MKRVHPKTRTPLIATILSGFLAAVMATIFNLHQLIDMMSIGTLLAYTIVAICILVLHYECPQNSPKNNSSDAFTMSSFVRQLVNFKFTKEPSSLSSDISKIAVCLFCVLATILCALLKLEFTSFVTLLTLIVVAGMILVILIISRQPTDESLELSFKVPMVPLLPCLSIFINLYLMFQLDGPTWIRFGVWVVIG
jgi:amino acid transporter